MFKFRWWSLPVLLVLGIGCGSALNAARRDAPAYTRSAEHYRHFPDADALSAYLRAGSDAGPLVSAHRGGPTAGYPENALATFEHTLRYAPALLECDVRRSRDGTLVLMHDETLDRTSTGSGLVHDHTLDELRALLLVDDRGVTTPFRIPTLDETLAWAEGRAVLTLDAKDDVPPRDLVAAVHRMHAENRVVLIVYDLSRLLTYHRLAPEMMISATVETEDDLEALLASGVDLSRIIAFTGVGEVRPEVIEGLHAHGIRAMLGTFDEIDERAARVGPVVYQALLDRGVDVIATDNVPLAARAVDAYAPAPTQ
ncbi:glycerophosphodiester phosphodiesterase family protein [Rhodocaloribacter sp.]